MGTFYRRIFTSIASISMMALFMITAFGGNVKTDRVVDVHLMATSEEQYGEDYSRFSPIWVLDGPGYLYRFPINETFYFDSKLSYSDPTTINIRYSRLEKNIIEGKDVFIPVESFEVPFEYDKKYQMQGFPGAEYIRIDAYDTVDGSGTFWCFYLDPNWTAPEKIYDSTGEWVSDLSGCRYEYSDHSYPKSRWVLIDRLWYYFDEEGYLLSNTTIAGGYYLNEQGTWIP